MKKLKMTCGSGYGEIRKDKGMFGVKYKELEKIFYSFIEAKIFFDSLNEEKAFWDFTLKPELCELYEWVEINKKMKLTNEMIKKAVSNNGGYTKKHLAIIGILWPPIKNWKDKIINIDFDIDTINNFINYNKTNK